MKRFKDILHNIAIEEITQEDLELDRHIEIALIHIQQIIDARLNKKGKTQCSPPSIKKSPSV